MRASMSRSMMSFVCVGIAVGATLISTADVASAACTRLGFSVNDYGKEGPARDAKKLLDGYIARQMAAKGVSKYRTGAKDVKCDLFLDFVVFDEYTCRAEATVCWDGSGSSSSSSDTSANSADDVAKPEPNERASVATGSISKKLEPVVDTKSVEKTNDAAAASPPASDDPAAAVAPINPTEDSAAP